jgi:hypothetical protein
LQPRSRDRRTYPRFEVVGALIGSLERWHRFHVRNVGPSGALVETEDGLLGGGISGWLTLREHRLGVQARVARTSLLAPSTTDKPTYLVGLDFAERLEGMTELLSNHPVVEAKLRPATDRRRSPRFECAGDVQLAVVVRISVPVVDLSRGGMMFTSPVSLEEGSRGRLTVCLTNTSFAADVEVRRIDALNAGYRIGASFVSMDDQSRQNLAAFLTAAEN